MDSGQVEAPYEDAKSLEVAKILLEGTDGTITVSTQGGGEFADAGITDMIYAVGISPQKLDRINRLRRKGVDLKVILDSREQAAALAGYVKQTADPIGALIEIDCDGNRSGVKPHEKEALLEIARILRDGRARWKEVLRTRVAMTKGQGRSRGGEQERSAVVDAEEISRGRFSCPSVSVGARNAYFDEDYPV